MALRRMLSEVPYRFATKAVVETEFCRSALKFMSTTPDGYRFAKSHEWTGPVDAAAKETTVGISDFAQNQLGDVVYVELPEIGHELKKGDAFGVVESVKAASDVYSPISGSVVSVNEALNDDPQLVNKSPYKDGWIMKIKYSSDSELSALMASADYDNYVAGLGE